MVYAQSMMRTSLAFFAVI